MAMDMLEYSLALPYNALARYPEALAAARRGCELHGWPKVVV